MRHPYIWLGGLVGVGVGPLLSARADAQVETPLVAVAPVSARVPRASAAAGMTTAAAAAAVSGCTDRPPVYTLRLTERQVMARFIPEVRARRDLLDRARTLWRTHFVAEADAIRLRFLQEDDWRPAFADAAALIDDFLEASLLPRTGEFPAGEGKVWVESIDPRSGQRVRARQKARVRPPHLAPKFGEKVDRDSQDKRRPLTKPTSIKPRKSARR